MFTTESASAACYYIIFYIILSIYMIYYIYIYIFHIIFYYIIMLKKWGNKKNTLSVIICNVTINYFNML